MDIGEAKELLKEMQENCKSKTIYKDEKAEAKAEAIGVVLKELDRMQEEISERIKLKVENERLVDKEFIYKGKIRELIKKLEKAEKDIKIDAGAFKLPKVDALTMFRLNILAVYASSVEVLRILLEEE